MAKTPPFSVCYQYCVGGGGENPGANAVQSDYTQNDSSKLDYIKNRPFYEITESIELLEVKKYGPDIMRIKLDTQQQLEGKKTIIEIVEDGITSKVVIDSVKDNQWTATDSGREYCYLSRNNLIDVDIVEGTKTVDAKVYCVTGVKQLDEKFIPDNIKYAYETEKKLGEAEADADMGTAFVICSEEIKVGDTILVKGYFNDGTTEEYTLEVPETDEGYTKIGTSDGRLGAINLPIPTTITFSCDVKGEVYKLNKKLISEATTELFGIVKEIDEALDRVIEKYGLGELTLEKLLADNPTAIGIHPNKEISAGTYKVLGCVSNEDSTLYTDKDLIIYCALYPVGSEPMDETILSPSQSFTIEADSVLEYPYISIDERGIEVTLYIVKVG